VGAGREWVDGKWLCGVFFPAVRESVRLEPPQLIVQTKDDRCEFDPQKPGLLEPSLSCTRTGRSRGPEREFRAPGRTPYLYYVRFNDGGLDRDLVRVPLTFTRLD